MARPHNLGTVTMTLVEYHDLLRYKEAFQKRNTVLIRRTGFSQSEYISLASVSEKDKALCEAITNITAEKEAIQEAFSIAEKEAAYWKYKAEDTEKRKWWQIWKRLYQ